MSGERIYFSHPLQKPAWSKNYFRFCLCLDGTQKLGKSRWWTKGQNVMSVGIFFLFLGWLGVGCFGLVWGFLFVCFRHYFYCSQKSVYDILQCLQFAAAYSLTHLYFPAKMDWVSWWKGGEKYVAAAFAWTHQNIPVQGIYFLKQLFCRARAV